MLLYVDHKVHGNFHAPCHVFCCKVHGKFYVPCHKSRCKIPEYFNVPCHVFRCKVHGSMYLAISFVARYTEISKYLAERFVKGKKKDN